MRVDNLRGGPFTACVQKDWHWYPMLVTIICTPQSFCRPVLRLLIRKMPFAKTNQVAGTNNWAPTEEERAKLLKEADASFRESEKRTQACQVACDGDGVTRCTKSWAACADGSIVDTL